MILSLSDYKDYPQYDSDMSDAKAQLLLDAAEAKYREIRNNDFDYVTATLTSGSAEITVDQYLKVGMPIYSASGQYGVITAVDNFTITSDTESTASASAAKLYVYPVGSRWTIAEMVAYMANRTPATADLSSESIFKHSWSRQAGSDLINGFPKSIVGGIRRMANLNGGGIRTWDND